ELGEPGRIAEGYERAIGDRGRLGEAGIVRRQIDLADKLIGGRDIADARKLEFLRQPVLQGAEHALRTPARFWRIGRDVLDAEPIERPADLSEPVLVHRLACL